MAQQIELDIPRFQPDIPPAILTVVPELRSEKPDPALGRVGSRFFFYALEEHHLSPIVMATDIAIASKTSISTRFQPLEAGRAFLGKPELVREVSKRTTRFTSQIPGKNEKPIRERAEEVFPIAQELIVLKIEQLEAIRSMYIADPGPTGLMYSESTARKRVKAMLDLAAGEGRVVDAEDRADLDLARGFDGSLLNRDEPKESPRPEAHFDLPPTGTIYVAESERTREKPVLVSV